MAPKIKKGNGQSAGRFTVPEAENYENKPPVFSLERLQDGKHGFTCLDREDKAQFSEAIFRRRAITWAEIKAANRHGLGFEKIARNAIKAGMPPFVTDDTDHFLAFRFSGMKPMVGYRIRDVFYVLWFDRDFTLYNHN